MLQVLPIVNSGVFAAGSTGWELKLQYDGLFNIFCFHERKSRSVFNLKNPPLDPRLCVRVKYDK